MIFFPSRKRENGGGFYACIIITRATRRLSACSGLTDATADAGAVDVALVGVWRHLFLLLLLLLALPHRDSFDGRQLVERRSLLARAALRPNTTTTTTAVAIAIAIGGSTMNVATGQRPSWKCVAAGAAPENKGRRQRAVKRSHERSFLRHGRRLGARGCGGWGGCGGDDAATP